MTSLAGRDSTRRIESVRKSHEPIAAVAITIAANPPPS